MFDINKGDIKITYYLQKNGLFRYKIASKNRLVEELNTHYQLPLYFYFNCKKRPTKRIMKVSKSNSLRSIREVIPLHI